MATFLICPPKNEGLSPVEGGLSPVARAGLSPAEGGLSPVAGGGLSPVAGGGLSPVARAGLSPVARVIDGNYGEFFTAENTEPGFTRHGSDYEKRPSGNSIISPSPPKRS